MSRASITKIDEDTWVITEGKGRGASHCYLIVGKNKACIIDTGLGLSNIRKAVKKITSLPVDVINTHGHLDHISKNYQFDHVYIHQADDTIYTAGIDFDNRRRLLISRLQKKGISQDILNSLIAKPFIYAFCHIKDECKRHYIKDGDIVDLGNRKLTIIETPGHTKGSVCVLDSQRRYLFTGDTICEQGVLLYFDHSDSLETYKKSLLKLLELNDQYDLIFGGHQKVPLNKTIICSFVELCDLIETETVSGERIGGIIIYKNKDAAISLPDVEKISLF
jgi:glyoxylase-like metal-dependent hydrolase (beta-lactamase superfamily II)